MTTFPILDNLYVASPCNASWDEMSGDERARHCQLCDKNVYNLSGMTRDEAEALLIQKEGRLCVRYYRRADGTVLTRDCPVGKERLARRIKIAAWASAGAAVAAVGTVLATLGIVDKPRCNTPVMGKIAAPVEIKGEVAPVMGAVAPPTGN